MYVRVNPDFTLIVPNLWSSINITLADSRNPFFLHTPAVYIPYYTIIEFIGYLGWIKVAETLLNPWGDDDEDFQINYLIDRNFQVSIISNSGIRLGMNYSVLNEANQNE